VVAQCSEFLIFEIRLIEVPSAYRCGFSGNATSMIGLCQEGKSSPDVLRRSAGVNSF
jgi:hypothetical protein